MEVCIMLKKKDKTDIRPFTAQFYRGSMGYLFLGIIETVIGAAGNLMIAWLIQQIIDLIAGYDTEIGRAHV